MRPTGRGQSWWWPIGPALCVGLAAVPAFTPQVLATGGLAIPAVATLFAVFLGPGLARSDWVASDSSSPMHVLARGFADAALLGSVAVGLASWLPTSMASWASLSVWLLAAVAVGYGRAGLLALPVVLGLAGSCVLLLGRAEPWGLLTPSVDAWSDWLSVALAVGALVSWGAGQWSFVPSPQPGRQSVPSLASGLALMAVLAACVGVAASWEHSLAGPPGPIVVVGMVLAAAMGAIATLQRASTPRWRLGIAGLGWLATLWFAGPAEGLRLAWWSANLPVLLGVAAGLRAIISRELRWSVAAVVLLGSAALSFGGVPTLVLPAVASVLPLVFAFWVAGTRAAFSRAL